MQITTPGALQGVRGYFYFFSSYVCSAISIAPYRAQKLTSESNWRKKKRSDKLPFLVHASARGNQYLTVKSPFRLAKYAATFLMSFFVRPWAIGDINGFLRAPDW